MKRARAWLVAIFWLSPALSQAQSPVHPLIFSREQIHIEAPAPSATPATPTPPPAAGDAPPAAVTPADSKPPATIHAPLLFDVELRPQEALQLEYIHSLNALTDNSGVLLALSRPAIAALPAYQVPTAVDALFVADDGRILQIYPQVVLAELTQQITPPGPIRAFLFLRSGRAQLAGIRPGDYVRASVFTPPPPLLKEAPPPLAR